MGSPQQGSNSTRSLSSAKTNSPTKSLRSARSKSPQKSPQKSPSRQQLQQLQSPVQLLSGPQTSFQAPIKNTNIKVIVRFRPENAMERNNGSENITHYDEDQRSVTINTSSSTNNFTFDHIFGEETTQEQIFNYSIKQTTGDLAQGYNGTVLCYGQTGSGKSHTMMGDLEDEAVKGLTPRIFEQIFQSIERSPKTLEYTVGVSYLEIYNENLKDLLNPKNNNKLSIHENKVDGVYVANLETLYVSNLNDVYTILEQGNLNRSVGSTNMNEQSSRSHAIFQIRLNSKNLDDGVIKTGNLFLVDLAGSEKIDKAGASGQLLEEAKKINSSLSALGNVINSLTDGKSTHIPYRDSKLTRILQESLGGNSRTTLIINCSPSSYNQQETLSTLRFGSRAKKIKNNVHINSELSNSELKKRYLDQVRLNDENQKKIQKIENRNQHLEEVNYQLKEELQKYKDLINLENTPDEISKLNSSIIELQTARSLLTKELESKSLRISELEQEASKSEQETTKLEALEKALSQFSSHIEQVENQNKQLRKDIQSLVEVSELKNQKIKELELQISEQDKLVEQDSSIFENKLNQLKSRLTSAKSTPTATNSKSQQISNLAQQHVDRIQEKENVVVDDNDLSNMRHSMKNRIGLNLRIVKPMRGGQEND